MSYSKLITQLIEQGYLKTPEIIEAFGKIKREDFVPEGLKHEAEGNYPLSIGYGQTISQPLTVAFMLELLEPKAGERILDIGSGSGWVTALLAKIVSKAEKGRVYAVERILELKEFGENNIRKYNFIEKGIVKFFCQDGTKGLSKYAPFDKIHVAAAAEKVPQALRDQLTVGGKMVIPISGGILKLNRVNKEEIKEEFFPGFAFVPLIKDNK